MRPTVIFRIITTIVYYSLLEKALQIQKWDFTKVLWSQNKYSKSSTLWKSDNKNYQLTTYGSYLGNESLREKFNVISSGYDH